MDKIINRTILTIFPASSILVILNSLCFSSTTIAQVVYPVIAHSHNDYEQNSPIHTALAHGFTSLEVDIVMNGNRIVVSHDLDHLEDKADFDKSYLSPLIAALPQEKQTFLIIDIKEYSPELIHQLNTILKTYHKYLIQRNDPSSIEHPLQIILSGDIPRKDIRDNSENIFLFIDGRLDELENNSMELYTPLISVNFDDITKWNGNRRPDNTTIRKIYTTIKTVHTSGKKIRFWNTEETPFLWSTLIGLEIDIIGVDNIEEFYLRMHTLNLATGSPEKY